MGALLLASVSGLLPSYRDRGCSFWFVKVYLLQSFRSVVNPGFYRPTSRSWLFPDLYRPALLSESYYPIWLR